MILLVVDTQKGCFNENLYAFETVRKNIKQLIAVARENNVEVVYVQHDDGPGTDLAKGTDNYEVYEDFAPRDDEKRFEKNVNIAFHPMTGLTEYLQSKGEKDIITIGVSTDYCMDATIKSGFEKGFNLFVPAYTNSTYDNPYFDKETAYKYFNEFMWGTRYAKIITVDQAIQLLQSEIKPADLQKQFQNNRERKMNFNPTEKEIDFINQALAKFNDEKVGPDNHELLNIVEYDENKNIIAGILGGTYWGWMHIDILWVDENFRKKGIGSQLLEAAEEEARKRGCHSVHVDTMSWQAPDFYKQHGYKIISELNDIPKGNKKFHLIKELNNL